MQLGTMPVVVIGHSAMGQAALPGVARGIAVPANKGYAVEQIEERLYVVIDGFYTADGAGCGPRRNVML
jgi:hypothetical protein